MLFTWILCDIAAPQRFWVFETHLGLAKSQSALTMPVLSVWNKNTNRFSPTPEENDVMTTSCCFFFFFFVFLISWVSQDRALAGKHEYMFSIWWLRILSHTQCIAMDDKSVFDLACLIWLCYYFVFIFHSFDGPCVFPIADQCRFLPLVPTAWKKTTWWTGEWRAIGIYFAPELSSLSCPPVAACQIKAVK